MIKKKCKENGIRGKHLGSNPHSNGEHFSRSKFVFFDKIDEIIINILEIKKKIVDIRNIILIIYIKNFKLFDWKSNILNILYKLINYLISK